MIHNKSDSISMIYDIKGVNNRNPISFPFQIQVISGKILQKIEIGSFFLRNDMLQVISLIENLNTIPYFSEIKKKKKKKRKFRKKFKFL